MTLHLLAYICLLFLCFASSHIDRNVVFCFTDLSVHCMFKDVFLQRHNHTVSCKHTIQVGERLKKMHCGKPISRATGCHLPYVITRHKWPHRVVTLSMQAADTQITCPGGMEGWVDLDWISWIGSQTRLVVCCQHCNISSRKGTYRKCNVSVGCQGAMSKVILWEALFYCVVFYFIFYRVLLLT